MPITGPDLPTSVWWILLGVLSLLLLWALWGWRRAATRVARANRRRQLLARRAESDAERWLADCGYILLERQPTRRWSLEVDGEPRYVSCRADLLVEHGGRCFVADVKTGTAAPRPELPATRRQLLEYLLAFEAEGVLLVDMHRRQIRSVSFPGLLRPTS